MISREFALASLAVAGMAAATAFAQEVQFNLPAQAAKTAIPEFGRQSGLQIMVDAALVEGQVTNTVEGRYEVHEALSALLRGTELSLASEGDGVVTLGRRPRSSGRGASSVLPPLAVSSTKGGTPPRPTIVIVEPASGELQEVIVTARKRNERLQDVPVAMTAFTAADLQRYATGSATDVANQTPKLIIGAAASPAGLTISLRGIGSAVTTPSVDQQVSINIDGVQMSQSNSLALGLYDLARVEVLKGPQALFFGKNSPGGVLSLVSADPGDHVEWRLRTGYEIEAARKAIEGMYSMPVTDTLGLRLVGSYADQEGWFRNAAHVTPGGGLGAANRTAPKQKEYFGRGTLVYKAPGGRFDANLKVSYGNQNGQSGILQQVYNCPLGTPQHGLTGAGAANACTFGRNIVQPDFSAAATATLPSFFRDGRPYSEVSQFLTALTMNLQLTPRLTMTSVSGYNDAHSQYTNNYSGGEQELLVSGGLTTLKQVTEELRLTSSFASPINFMFGAYYQHARLGVDSPNTLGAPLMAFLTGNPNALPALYVYDSFLQDTSAYSVFGQLVWKLSPKWELTAGARTSQETKSETGMRLPSLLSGFTTAPFVFVPAKVSFSNVSPEATLSFHPTQDLNLYGAYREGFTSGGFNLSTLSYSTTAPNSDDFKQATVSGGEIGAKGTLADRQVRFDLTVYNYSYKNLQLATYDTNKNTVAIVNAGKARVRGVELSARFEPSRIPGLGLRSDVAYNDARYLSYQTAGCFTGQTLAEGCNQGVVAGVGNSQDLSGHQMERAPRWTINFGATHAHALGNGMSLDFSVDESHTSGYIAEVEQDPASFQDSTWKTNASIRIGGRDGSWELALIGKNLTNELRAISSYGTPFTGFGTGTTGPSLRADLMGTVSDPRTVLVQVTFHGR